MTGVQTCALPIFSSSGGNVTTCGGAVTHQASEAGSYSVKLSDGTTANINIESVKPSVSLTSFDLSLESWGPDEAVNDVNPTISKKTTLNFTDSTLCAWNELSVTQEQLSDLGVASMADVSGIGRYTTTFTLPENWSAQDGATLKDVYKRQVYTSSLNVARYILYQMPLTMSSEFKNF